MLYGIVQVISRSHFQRLVLNLSAKVALLSTAAAVCTNDPREPVLLKASCQAHLVDLHSSQHSCLEIE